MKHAAPANAGCIGSRDMVVWVVHVSTMYTRNMLSRTDPACGWTDGKRGERWSGDGPVRVGIANPYSGHHSATQARAEAAECSYIAIPSHSTERPHATSHPGMRPRHGDTDRLWSQSKLWAINCGCMQPGVGGWVRKVTAASRHALRNDLDRLARVEGRSG